jgi:predicted HTH transcriptional regulator
MIFFSKPLTDIRQGDLEAVVQQNVRERQTLEFKRDSYPRNPQGTREMLRDVTAMANAFGGEIVLGEVMGDAP